MSGADGGTGGNEGKGGDGAGKAGDGGFTPITYNSQAELDAAFQSRTDQAKRAVLKDLPEGKTLDDILAGYKAYTEAEDAKKDEITKERERAEAAEAKNKAYEAKQARDTLAGKVAENVKIGETAIPASLLSGTTQEELEASAKAIKAFVETLIPAPRAPEYNPFQGGPPAGGPAGTPPKEDPLRTYFSTGSFA